MVPDRLRRWVGEEPPAELHDPFKTVDGRIIEPWLVPIEVVDSSKSVPPVRVTRQGEAGTMPKTRGVISDLMVYPAERGEPIASRSTEPSQLT